MLRGVTDLNVNFLGNWDLLPGVSHYVFRSIGVRATHGAFTSTDIPTLCATLPFQISHQDVFASRPISLYGLCAANVSGELTRHRNLSARAPSQALSLVYTMQHCQEYAGRCQRTARLSHLHGLRDEPDPHGQATIRPRQLLRSSWNRRSTHSIPRRSTYA